MDQEIILGSNNLYLSKHLKKFFYSDIQGNEILIPLRNNSCQDRKISETEWDQEYYIIYNSYILEDKDL